MKEALFAIVVLAGLGFLIRKAIQMSEATDRLIREVQESRAATESIVALVAGLAQEIRDNIDDEDALNELADSLDADQAKIAEAVAANTSAPPTEPEPEA